MARKSPKKSASKTDSKRKALTARKTPANSLAKASAKTLKKSAKPKTSTTKPSANKTSANKASSTMATTLHEGDRAPDFTLQRDGDSVVRLADFAERKLVVFFYPRADTPGCTKEACGFRDALADYDKAKVVVLGISPDEPKDVTKFSEKFHLNFPLLADADHAVAEKYGAWQQKSMYGRKYMGAARITFVIGKNGKVRHVFEKVKPEGHDQEVLKWLKENPE